MYARGVGLGLPEEPDRRDLQQLLDATRDTPAARAIHYAVLRTFATASYSPALIGHFALASDHYAHFTSPIRRYPDLAVHRVLEAYLDATGNGREVPGGRGRRELGRRVASDGRALDEDQLVQLGRHCTDTEVEAEAAERELRDFLVMQFLEEHHLGDEFTGVVTGVTSGGLFVSVERFLVEGLVRLHDVHDRGARPDQWRIDDRTGRLVARRSGASLAVGDIVTVEIQRVDLASRHLDLRLIEMPRKAGSAPAAAPLPKGKRKGKGGYKQGRRGRRSR